MDALKRRPGGGGITTSPPLAAQLARTAKTRDLAYEARRERREVQVSKALAEHQSKRKK